ncbi:MAG TPA: extracellular solute-binding protein, partial [Dermatophilaceae bacterium]|nr:extracellular solute-binding protein [Dermatophilaceae bacterium]
WAIPVYKDKVNWGVAPVPTSAGMTADKVHTFSDAKNIAMYSACKNQGTAWDLLKFATSQEQDGALLNLTGQMPLRKDVATVYADYLTKNPAYKAFADQSARTVEVPNVANSIAIWQAFRDNYSSSVIFGKTPVDAGLKTTADKVNTLAGQS